MFQCKHSDKFDINAKHYEYIVQAHKIKNFCDLNISDSRISPSHVFQELEFRTCPCGLANSQATAIIELEAQYHKFGISSIYSNKSLLEAPAKLIAAFRCIRAFLTDYEKKMFEKAQKEAEIKMKAAQIKKR